MNPYAILGIIATSTAMLAGVVSLLVAQGVSLLVAFFGVYLFAVLMMLRMQITAERYYDDSEQADHSYQLADSEVREINLVDYEDKGAFERIA